MGSVRSVLRASAVLVAAVVAAPFVATGAETGLASFYAKRFHGRTTSSGQRFDAGSLTAAHPSHPHGTRVRVTNVENGKSVEVRIVDRGPSKANRREGVIIDLSRAAADRLGFVKKGRTRVRVDGVQPTPRANSSDRR